MTARKNPQGAIRAFQQAFGRKETGVGLVLKCTRVAGRSDQAKALEALQALTANDPRIHWVDRVLIRGDILDLMHCCDSFVSLHRAEGFGMGIAEAMLMGKPVIVTNYSGNTEFTRYGNSCLVDYTLIPVQAGEYPFHEGQHWASPDLEQAAHWMRKIADDPGFASTIGARARKVIAKEYGLEVVGQKMRERLEFLGLLGR